MPQASDLRQAVCRNDIESLKALLGSDPWLVVASTTDPDKETALHAAAALGLVDIAELLIAERAKVEARDDYGRTPLHRAAWAGHVGVVKALLAHHADVTARDKTGRTVLTRETDAPVSRGVWETLRDWVTIHQAASLGDVEIVAAILQKHPDLLDARDDEPDCEGSTPLFHAVAADALSVAELLLSKGADANAVDESGEGLLSASASVEMAELLRRWGARH